MRGLRLMRQARKNNSESSMQAADFKGKMVGRAGFEPATNWLKATSANRLLLNIFNALKNNSSHRKNMATLSNAHKALGVLAAMRQFLGCVKRNHPNS